MRRRDRPPPQVRNAGDLAKRGLQPTQEDIDFDTIMKEAENMRPQASNGFPDEVQEAETMYQLTYGDTTAPQTVIEEMIQFYRTYPEAFEATYNDKRYGRNWKNRQGLIVQSMIYRRFPSLWHINSGLDERNKWASRLYDEMQRRQIWIPQHYAGPDAAAMIDDYVYDIWPEYEVSPSDTRQWQDWKKAQRRS